MSAHDPVGTTPHIDALHFLGLDERAHLRAVVAALRRNHATLFAGAGLSFNARCNDGSDRTMPSWQALVQALAAELEGVSGHDDALKVADLFEATHGRARLGEKLRAQIPDADFAPGDVHKLIPLMGFREVITTNFDTLIERAFRARAIEPKVVVSGKDLVQPAWPRVVKANGCFDRAPDDVVITGEDFRRFEGDRPLLVSFLTHVFVESLVLFVGFSLDDPAFRAIFGRVRDLLGRDGRVAYSIQGWLPPSQVAFWAHRGLRIISLWSGTDDPELTFGARLFRVLEALLADTRAEATAAGPVTPLGPRLNTPAFNGPLRDAQAWTRRWRASESEPGLVLASLLPTAERQRLAAHPAFEEELGGRRAPDPHRALAPETLRAVRAACCGLDHATGTGSSGGGPAGEPTGNTYGAPTSAPMVAPTFALGVEGQRAAVALLGAAVDQRRAPGRSAAGLFGVAWTRQLIEAVAECISETQLGAGDDTADLDPRAPAPTGIPARASANATGGPRAARTPGPTWICDVPALLAQVRLLCWLESPTAATRLRFARAARAVDLRCLAAESDARQREAALHLMLHGSAADLDLVPGLLRRAADGRAIAQRVARRESAWVARPAVTETPTRGGPGAPAPALTRAAEQRIRDLAPDVRFRLGTFADAARDHAAEYLEVLDWLRQMLHDQGPERLDGATLDLVYRHHHLYNDFDDLDADLREEAHTPFHRRVRAENAAIVERAERSGRLLQFNDRAERVRSHLRAALCALERGKSLARGPRTALDDAWREARELLAERPEHTADFRGVQESGGGPDPGRGGPERAEGAAGEEPNEVVAWELLVMLAVQADGAAFERRRGPLFVELLRQRRLDFAFLVDGWRRRLGATDFAGVAWTDARGARVEDGGLHATLLGVAAGIKLAVQHVPWDPEARPEDARLLTSLTDLTVRVLCAHHTQVNLRDNLLAALAGLTRVAPVPAVRAAVRRWVATCARQLPDGRLGLGSLCWSRLLTVNEPGPTPTGDRAPALDGPLIDGTALQVLLGRARAERHRAQGQDLFEAFADLHALLPEALQGAVGRPAGLALGGPGPIDPESAHPTPIDTDQTGLAHNGPVHGGPVHDGPAHDGPVRNGPVRNGPVRNGPANNSAVLAGHPNASSTHVGLGHAGLAAHETVHELQRQIRSGLLEIFAAFRSPDAFAWLSLAARLRAAGLPLTATDLEPHLHPLCADDTSPRARTRRFDWQRRLPAYLRGLTPFAGELSPAVRDWVLHHLDADPEVPAGLPTAEQLAHWSPDRLDAVAAFAAALLPTLRRSEPLAAERLEPLLVALVQAGATGQGALGGVLDALGEARLDLWANHAARLGVSEPRRHAPAAVARAAEEAIECLRRLAAVAPGAAEPLLEVRLIEAVPSPPAVAWLAEKLTKDLAFAARHALLLRVLRRHLVPPQGPDDAPTRRLRTALASL